MTTIAITLFRTESDSVYNGELRWMGTIPTNEADWDEISCELEPIEVEAKWEDADSMAKEIRYQLFEGKSEEIVRDIDGYKVYSDGILVAEVKNADE